MRHLPLLILLCFGLPEMAHAVDVPVPVTIVKPARRDMVRWIKLPGSVEADAEVTLYAKVSGFMKDLKVDAGDKIKPGDVIGRLDAPEYDQEVKLAEAQL